MDRKLLDYLPPVLREVMEMQAINEANEPEISIAWDALALVLANQFLETADARGLSVWETELKIFPKDTDSLEERRARIKAMWNLEIPYTIPWLKRWLTGICGPTGHEVTVEDYTICVRLDHGIVPEANFLEVEILKRILEVRPSNMRLLMESIAPPMLTTLHYAGAAVSYSRTKLPEWRMDQSFTKTLNIAGAFAVRSRTGLPPVE